MKASEIPSTCVYHHSATRRGYVSRKVLEPEAEPYSGRFGRGYIVRLPRWDTTQYVTVDYFIEKSTPV